MKSASDTTVPVKIPVLICGANANVVQKVRAAASASSRLASHAERRLRRLMRLESAMMMMAASTGCGRCLSSGVKKRTVISTHVAQAMEEMPVRALAARLSAERENDPLTG